jgi:hypothetical protein
MAFSKVVRFFREMSKDAITGHGGAQKQSYQKGSTFLSREKI